MAMGVFPDSGIRFLRRKRVIRSKNSFSEGQVQASTLDLRFGHKGYCLPCSSLQFSDDLERSLRSIANYPVDLRENNFLHRDKTYVFELQEALELEESLAGRANPKSSNGRVDGHARLVTEHGNSFDNIPANYQGRLWVETFPFSFDMRLTPGCSLNQLRIFDEDTDWIDKRELLCFHRDEGLLYHNGKKLSEDEMEEAISGKSLDLRLDLSRKVIGYKAKPNAPPVDFSRRDLQAEEYFDKVIRNKDGVIIDRGAFYIFSSLERVKIPLELCAEMEDIKTGLGEYRAHYAGFFDPGFFATATLEMRNLGPPFLLRDEQKIASLRFMRMKSKPKKSYGEGSHYQGQRGPKLAKFFA